MKGFYDEKIERTILQSYNPTNPNSDNVAKLSELGFIRLQDYRIKKLDAQSLNPKNPKYPNSDNVKTV